MLRKFLTMNLILRKRSKNKTLDFFSHLKTINNKTIILHNTKFFKIRIMISCNYFCENSIKIK